VVLLAIAAIGTMLFRRLLERSNDAFAPRRVSFPKVRKSSSRTASAVPLSAQYLLLLIPRKDREHIISDLEEEFHTIVLPQYGLRRAKTYYWCQTFASLAHYILPFVKRAIGVTVILKLIGK